MKYLTHFQDFKTRAQKPVVFLNKGRLDSGQEQEKGIEAILQNPLSFSLSDIARLELAIKEKNQSLESGQQRQFSQLINYQLARIQNEGPKSKHSRTLFGVFRSPSLNQFLTASQRREVEMLLNKERKDLEKLGAKDIKKWTAEEAIRMARSYRFVRNRLNTANLRINPEFKNAGDNLKNYAAVLVEKTELSAVDKLFLIELKRIFPASDDWNDQSVYRGVLQQATKLESDLVESFSGGGNIPAEAHTYWDTLVPETGSSAESQAPLSAWLKQSAEVESLQAILDKDKSGAEVADSAVPLLLSFEEYEFLQNLKNREADFGLNLNGEIQEKLNQQAAIIEDAETDFKQAEEASNNELEALNKASLAALKEHPKLSVNQKNSFKDEWLSLEGSSADTETTESGQWRKQALQDLSESVKKEHEQNLKNKKEALESAKKMQAELEKEQAEFVKNMGVYSQPHKVAQKALENHKKYFNARFKAGRLLAVDLDLMAQLSAPEVNSIGDLLSENDPQKGRKIMEVIADTRALIEQAISSDLQINDLNNLSETELNSVDKFLSYEGVLQTIVTAKKKNQDSELLRNFEALDKSDILDARQVITAATMSVRREVLANIDSQTTRKSDVYNQFIDQYSRQHHAINQTSKVEELLKFSESIERKKQDKVKNIYEHAHEKVSSLFAAAEEPALIDGLNKVLKTGVSAESVLEDIKDATAEGPVIHNASKGQIEAWKQLIVRVLKDKVTPENSDAPHLEKLAQDLLSKLDQMKAAAVAKEALRAGAVQIEQTDEDNLAVSDRLELARRTHLVFLEVSDVNEDFQSQLDDIKLALDKGENPDYLVSRFLQNYDQHFKPKLEVLREALVAECDLHFNGNRLPFTDNLKAAITVALKHLNVGVDQLRKNHNDKNEDLSVHDVGFKKLISAMNNEILPLYNLESGTMAKAENVKLDSTLHNAAKTHQYVRDELGVLQVNGAEKARENYQKQLAEYKATVSGFKHAWEEAKARLEKDLSKYNEEEFAHKHSMPKKKAREIIAGNEFRYNDAQWMVDYFSGKNSESPVSGSESGVFDRWLAAYENAETQPKALKFMDNFKEFKNILGEDQEGFEKEREGFLGFVRDYDNNKPTLWFKKRYKITVSWYSLRSIYMMGKQAWEFWSKRTERRNDRMASELGDKLFGETWLGREFARDSNEKQDQRVSDFKNVHKSSNYQQLFKIIENANDAGNDMDEVQAAVELIMEKGELRWDSPEFLGMLDRLQDVVSFNPEEDIKAYIENPALLKQKIGQAVTTIWDRPTWLQWKEDLPSKYKSRVESHNNDYREEVQKGSVDAYLGGVLDQWSRGEMDTNFERSKFESYLKNAFDNGEMNGYPNGDRRWYYLIMGLTLKNPQGDTILSPDTLSRFGELQNKMPFMDAFDDGASAKLNGRVVPDGTPGSHKSWTYEDFQAWSKYFDGVDPRNANKPETIKKVRTWLNETLLTTNDSQDRMAKVQLTGIDRDDAGILPLLVSSERLRDGILRYSSGDKRPADDKYYVNLIGSFKNNFEDSVEYMKRILHDEDKEAEGYELRKKTQLLRFGEMMRSYFMISQVLAGNWDTGGSVGAVVLSQAEWNNNGCAEQYEKITDSMATFLGGEEEAKLKFLKDQHIQKQKSGVYQKENPNSEEAKAWNFSDKIYEDEHNKFQNLDLIQRFIESQ